MNNYTLTGQEFHNIGHFYDFSYVTGTLNYGMYYTLISVTK